MAGLLYYVPGKQHGLKPDDLKALGLEDLFPPGTMVSRQVTGNGPDGSSGMILADGSTFSAAEESLIGYYPEARPHPTGIWQRWMPMANHKAKPWIGFFPDSMPRPIDLQRPAGLMLPGHKVFLADGQEWIIPVARALVEDDGAERDLAGIADHILHPARVVLLRARAGDRIGHQVRDGGRVKAGPVVGGKRHGWEPPRGQLAAGPENIIPGERRVSRRSWRREAGGEQIASRSLLRRDNSHVTILK